VADYKVFGLAPYKFVNEKPPKACPNPYFVNKYYTYIQPLGIKWYKNV
jgi:hypothetical protein